MSEELRDLGAAGEPSTETHCLGEASTRRLAIRGDSLERGATVGRYVVLDRIGSGGMGVVYSAYDPELDRKVALKLLRPDRAAFSAEAGRLRLLREAQAIARLSHPNVIAVYDAGTMGSQVFVAMEFVEGCTLRQFLKDQRPSWRRVLDLFLLAGRGLAAAHAAGLAHRDFKPDNVLLGRDGRVRVVDFGLARPLEQPAGAEAESSPASSGGILASPLTQGGVALGTPGYMSPEQLRGEAADARSDQFSFCVALYEALYGERPFAGDSLRELAAAVVRGELREAPEGTPVPGWLRQVLLRGLAASSAARYPEMEDLLRALEHPAAARRLRWLAAAGVLLAAATLFSGLGYFQARRGQLCGGAEEEIEGIWSSRRRELARDAFLASGVPFAATAWRRAEADLDRFGRAWMDMRRQACEATRLRGQQSEDLLDRRMFCLDQRLKEMSAVVDLLAHADRRVVVNSASTVPSPARLGACADAPSLLARVPPPRDPAVLAKVKQLQGDLSAARALGAAGKEEEAAARLRPLVGALRALGYQPLEAEVLYYLGFWEDRLGRSREAEAHSLEALFAAQAGTYQEMVARTASELSWIVGVRLARTEEGGRWARLAQASVDGLKGGAALRADLLMDFASLLQRQGRSSEAAAVTRRALTLVEQGLGAEHLYAADLWSNLGVFYNELGRNQEALAASRRSLEIRRRILSPDHPDFARSYNTLGNIALDLGQRDQAADYYRRAHRAFEASYGSQHPDTAGVLTNLALVLKDRGRYEEALRIHRQAEGVFERNFGRQHPYVSMTLGARGEIRSLQGLHHEALRLYREAVAIDRQVLGDSHPDLAYSLHGLGLSLLGLGRPAQAADPLTRAVVLRESGEAEPRLLAESRWALARALWDSGRGRARSVRLAREARDAFVAAGATAGRDLEQVEAWLAHHSIGRSRSLG